MKKGLKCTILAVLLAFGLFLGGCDEGSGGSGGGNGKSGKDNEEDQTCWADTAADLLQAHGVKGEHRSYDEMVRFFGNRPFYTHTALRWWLAKEGLHKHWKVGKMVKGGGNTGNDLQDKAYRLFLLGQPAIGFQVKRHMMTARKYAGLKYDKLYLIVWLVYDGPLATGNPTTVEPTTDTTTKEEPTARAAAEPPKEAFNDET